MSLHLSILRDMYPDRVYLDVGDIAKLFRVSKSHIYRVSSQRKLPFKHISSDISDRILVSIVEVARYLDSRLEIIEGPDKPPVFLMISPKRKRGRPRGGGAILSSQ